MQSRKKRQRRIDRASIITLVITVVLFIIAIFEKGFTHELLLEAGVFLVSVKLMLSASKTDLTLHDLQDQLDAIEDKINKRH